MRAAGSKVLGSNVGQNMAWLHCCCVCWVLSPIAAYPIESDTCTHFCTELAWPSDQPWRCCVRCAISSLASRHLLRRQRATPALAGSSVARRAANRIHPYAPYHIKRFFQYLQRLDNDPVRSAFESFLENRRKAIHNDFHNQYDLGVGNSIGSLGLRMVHQALASD